jgi:hypothetical protein
MKVPPAEIIQLLPKPVMIATWGDPRPVVAEEAFSGPVRV